MLFRSLSVAAPANNLVTNKAACTVSGTTNDATSSPVKVTIKLNSGTAEAVTVNADGSFSKALTLANGENTITVVATDGAGKTTTVVRKVTLDTKAPVIKSVTITPNPVDCDPSVTRYELSPAPGVKISKITNLSDDIALNLAANGVRSEEHTSELQSQR